MALKEHDIVSGRVWSLQAECDSVSEHFRVASGVCGAEIDRAW